MKVFLCLLTLAGPSAYALDAENGEPRRLELALYGELKIYRDVADQLCQRFGVDRRVLYSCIYIEMAQYQLDPARQVKKLLEKPLMDFTAATGFSLWPNLSLGFAHIKPSFARETWQRLQQDPRWRGLLGDKEVEPLYYSRHPWACLKIAVAGLYLLQEQWRREGIDLSARPEILATLYNLGYAKSHPHPQPQTGGTTMPFIVDGRLVTNMTFGDKVTLLLTQGQRMREFLAGK